MKKVFLINSLTSGGGERQASYLIKNKFFDHVFTILPENSYGIPSQDFEVIGGKVYDLNQFTKLIMLPFIAIKILNKVKEPFEFISFLEVSNFINVFAKIFRPSNKCIISLRTIPSMQFRGVSGSVNKILITLLYPKADLIVSNSQGGKKDLIDNFKIEGTKIVVIPNAYDIENIREKSEEPLAKEVQAFFDNHDVLIMSGRFTFGKGQVELLSIFKLLVLQNSNLKLVFLGEGELLESCMARCRDLNLSFQSLQGKRLDFDEAKQVYFLGFRSNPYSLIKNARLFVMASMWEGYPNVIAESIILGTLVVSADCPSGPREILEIENNELCGVLLPTFTSEMGTDEKDWLVKFWADQLLLIIHSNKDQNFKSSMIKKSLTLASDNVMKRWVEEIFVLRK